jgi:hypothetical protein
MNNTRTIGSVIKMGLNANPGEAKSGFPLVVSATTFGPTNYAHAFHLVTIESLRDLYSSKKAQNLRVVLKQINVSEKNVDLVLLADVISADDYTPDQTVSGPILGDFILQLQDPEAVIGFVNRLVEVMALDTQRIYAKTPAGSELAAKQ